MADSPLDAVVEIPKGSSNKYEWDDGWYPREHALESIERARRRWRDARDGNA